MTQTHRTTPFEVEDDVDILLGRLEGVRPLGPHSWMARCPAHEDRDPSLSVSVKEGRVLLHCFAGCAPEAVLEAVGLTWKDLRGGESWAWRPPVLRPSRPRPEPEGPSPEDLERWERLWEAAKPDHPLLRRYLKARGLSLEPPPTLRVAFLRGVPVVVARVEGEGGHFGAPTPQMNLLGLHLTFLEPDGRGRKGKRLAKGSKPKGGAIRLFPLEAGQPLALAEGIETALAVREATGWPVWALVAASFLKEASLPPEAHEVVVCADHDKAGLEAGKALARGLLREGRRVRLAVPPVEGEDWLDTLTRLGHEEVGGLIQRAPGVEPPPDLVQTEGFCAKAFAQNQPAPGRYSAYFVQRYIHDGREANPWEEKGGGPWR
jgi:putative DNA primase/helicase